jgi:hypothetical protein
MSNRHYARAQSAMNPPVRALRHALPVLAAVSLVGCGGGSQPQAGASSGTTRGTPAAAASQPAATSGPTKTLTAVLNPENGGTVQATLTLTIGAGSYKFRVEGQSLHPRGIYLVNTHLGTCAAEDVTLSQGVGNLVGDGSGNGLIERTYGRAYAGGGIITIHDYAGSGGESGHIACAELPAG